MIMSKVKQDNNSRHRLVASVVVLVVLGLVVGALCMGAVWLGDDIYFSFNLGEGDWFDRVDSLRKIVISQSQYYMTRNGRFVTHCVVQYFCGMGGKTLFAVCNALMWMAFIVVLLRAARFNWLKNTWATAAVALLAFVSLRTQFSPPCQVNYIWAMTAALLVVNWFLRGLDGHRPWVVVLMAAVAFLAGWGQESFSSGLAAAMWIYALKHFKSMRWQRWLVLGAFTAGMLFLCLAPGNFAKMGAYSSLRITPIAMAYYLRATYVLLAVVLYLAIVKKVPLVKMYRENAFWCHAMLFMLLFNVLVKVYCNRQLFGIEVMSIIIAIRLVRDHLALSARARQLTLLLLVVWVVLVVADDMRTITRRAAVVDQLDRLYHESPDGTVYCDIDDKEYFYHDEDAMNCLNNWTLIQLSHLWESQGGKPLKWRPRSARQYVGKNLPSQVIRLDDDQHIFMLVHNRLQDSCKYVLHSSWHYGPVMVVRMMSHVQSKHLVGENNPCSVSDSCYEALIWRQNDAFIQNDSARLVQ